MLKGKIVLVHEAYVMVFFGGGSAEKRSQQGKDTHEHPMPSGVLLFSALVA